MKKITALITLALCPVLITPGHCFIDYLFGGSAMSDSIGNNVVGDLRAWWTGNPVYNFNPYYSGNNQGMPAQNPNQGGNFQQMPQQFSGQANQQPSVTYYPPQGQQQYGYPQGQAMQAPPQMQQQYQQMPPQAQQQYQQMPPQYQQMPQQAYQMPAPPAQGQYYPQEQYQGPPQGYGYGQAPQGYDQQGPPPGSRFQTFQYEHEASD